MTYEFVNSRFRHGYATNSVTPPQVDAAKHPEWCTSETFRTDKTAGKIAYGVDTFNLGPPISPLRHFSHSPADADHQPVEPGAVDSGAVSQETC